MVCIGICEYDSVVIVCIGAGSYDSVVMVCIGISMTCDGPDGTMGPIEPVVIGCVGIIIGSDATGSSVYSSVAEASIRGRMARSIASRAAVDALAPLA